MTDDCFLSSLLPVAAVAMVLLFSWVLPEAEAASPNEVRAGIDVPSIPEVCSGDLLQKRDLAGDVNVRGQTVEPR